MRTLKIIFNQWTDNLHAAFFKNPDNYFLRKRGG